MRGNAARFWEISLWLLAALALLVPLFVVRHIVMDLVFIKLTAFQVLVTLMTAVYFVLLGINPIKYRPRFSWLTVAVLIFGGVLTLSTFTSTDPTVSFWGDINRLSGLFAYLHYIAFFLILSWSLTEKRQWLGLLQTSIWVSLAVVLYSLAQYFSLPLVREAVGSRLVGPTSNALVLAEYLLLMFFPTVVYGLRTKSQWLKWSFLIVALLQVLVLSLTDSSGALAALAIGIIVLIPAYVWLNHHAWFKRSLLIILGLVIVGGLSFWGLSSMDLPERSWLNKVVAVDLSDASFQHRVHSWNISLNAWREKPLLGFGLDNFSIAFQRHYEPLAELSGRDPETWFDRAHNSFIDYLVAAGLIGLLAYLLVIVIAWAQSLKIIVRKGALKWQRSVGVAMLSTISAYIIFNLWAFSVVSSFIVFLFLLALLNSFYTSRNRERDGPSRVKWLWYIMAFIILIGLIPFQLRSASANRTAGRATTALLSQNFDRGMELLNKSLAYNMPINPAIAARMLEVGGKLMSEQSNPVAYSTLINLAEIYEDNIASSLNGQHWSILANYYGQLLVSDTTLVGKTNELYQKTLDLAPRRPLIYLVWGSNLTKGGYSLQAFDKYQRAVAVYPEMPLAHFWLGLGHTSLKRFDEGEVAFDRAVELGFDRNKPDNLFLIANAFEIAGAYPQAEAIYKRIIQDTGGQAESYYFAIEFYRRVGWDRQAQALAEDYLKISPNDPTALQMIKEIKQNK